MSSRQRGINLLIVVTFPLLIVLLIIVTIIAVVGRLIKKIIGIDRDESDETYE